MRKLVFIVAAVLIVLGAVTSVFGDGQGKRTQTYYEEISACKGDTYWSIAQRYKSDGMNKSEYVEYIMDFNGAINDKLFAGQKILVPVIEYI